MLPRTVKLWRCAQSVKSSVSSKSAIEACQRHSGYLSPGGNASSSLVRTNTSAAGVKPGQQAVSNALLVDTLDMVRILIAHQM